jgi:phosphatidylglycerol lysyltransferase
MKMLSSRFMQLSRRLLPLGMGLALFGLGVWALMRLLKPVHAEDVFAQMRGVPLPMLVTAVAATAVGYLALIGYDFWALRFLGKKLPPRVVVLGGFLGYAFGNTIGISVISGGAVRYRIYAAFGLNAFEVAAVSSYIAIALGTGLTLIGLVALAFHPQVLHGILPLSPGEVQLGAAFIAVAMVVTLVALSISGRSLKVWKIELSVPPMSMLLGQLAVTVVDVVAAALTLYVLLPAGGPDFSAFVAIYAVAMMVGILSHVPGGVGVFETMVIAAMPEGTAVGEIAAALLLFRIIYYLLPFALAFLIVSFNEARHAGGFLARMFGDSPAALRPAFAAVSGVVPALVAAVAFGLGCYLLLVAMLPSVRANAYDDAELIAAILLEGGTLVSAVAGVVLVILSHGLVRRVSGAYWLTLAAIAGGAVAALLNDLDLESVALLGVGGFAMLPFSNAFYRRTKLTEGVFSPAWFALIAALGLAVAAFFFFVHEATPYSLDLLIDFGKSANTPRSLRAGLAASAVVLVFLVFLALQPARKRDATSDTETLAKVARVLRMQNDPQACLALSGDKRIHFNESEQAFVMYGIRGKLWIAFGNPIGPTDQAGTLAWDFMEAAQAANCAPVFYEVSEAYLSIWIEMGLALHKVGEEAVIRLPEFSLAGARFKTMRAAFNKKQRDGFTLSFSEAPHSPALLSELAEVSTLWLDGKAGREKGFSVGHFSPDYLNNFPIALIKREEKVIAFASIMAPGTGQNVAIDLMRYRPEEGSGMMEFLFLSLIEHYRTAGAQELSLGVAPLAGLSERRSARMWSKMGVMMFRHGGAFYNFEGLRAFKQKFQPEWRPRYLALAPGVSPMVAMADVALLISGGARGLIGK